MEEAQALTALSFPGMAVKPKFGGTGIWWAVFKSLLSGSVCIGEWQEESSFSDHPIHNPAKPAERGDMPWLEAHKDIKWGKASQKHNSSWHFSIPCICYLGALSHIVSSQLQEQGFLLPALQGPVTWRRASCISSPDHAVTKLSEQLWQHHLCSNVWWERHIALPRPSGEDGIRNRGQQVISFVNCIDLMLKGSKME